jgi:hypothetical protein
MESILSLVLLKSMTTITLKKNPSIWHRMSSQWPLQLEITWTESTNKIPLLCAGRLEYLSQMEKMTSVQSSK